MMWQDFVFLVGSMTSVMFLYPTLRDKASRVPRATSIPSMLIGGVYSLTFFTLGMHFSAFGSFAACTMWSLIALFRNPEDESLAAGLPFGHRIKQLLGGTPQPHASGDDDVDAAPNSD
ncbi:hypothetical protein [Halobacterium sp. R2-5]|uniref:hypothetical protein n=1 Tax=Halobacterium sp. R2-5 TaxID=2715751 RepID=UPI001AAED37F|nr:hypothetical protein [Halobacterium sp. R2-5]